MREKPKVFFTSNVFTPEEMGENESVNQDLRASIRILWSQLEEIADIKVFNGRFPNPKEIEAIVESFNPLFLGCHLSHLIYPNILEKSNLIAVSTATVGYNHIQLPKDNNVLITHTPGVLYKAVADYTIALIMSNLRNLIDLHNYVWNGKWTVSDKWDIDQNLSTSFTNKILGIVGLGEIGSEIAKKLKNFGNKILYYDILQRVELENQIPNLEYTPDLRKLFAKADIISLHIPLNRKTKNIINRDLLKLMKHNSLLVNTARGGILNLNDFLDLLEHQEIFVNFAFDVYPQEPINKKTLERIKAIKISQPQIKITLMPHNASADSNTRAKMIILFLEDIIKLAKSKSLEDLNNIHIIPEQQKKLHEIKWRIIDYWQHI